jgi:hypothetical protein
VTRLVTFRPPARRFALTATTLLLAVTVACSGSDSNAPGGDAAPVAPTAPTTAATASPAATTTTAELEAMLSELEARAVELRGLAPGGPVKRNLVDAAAVRTVILDSLEEPETQEELARLELLYRLLGLIEPGSSLAAIYEGLLTEQVLGLYNAERGEIFVIMDERFDALERISYVHEYVHYLQDAAFDLEALNDRARHEPDRGLALSALVEGDATLAQQQYMLTGTDRAELLELLELVAQQGAQATEGAGGDGRAAATPFAVQRGLEFSYLAGLEFATVLFQAGGFARIDEAFASPPVTTEQILHPSKYLAGEVALDVAVPDLSAALDGWTVIDRFSLGEFLVGTWLRALGAAREAAERAAAGWGGDTAIVLEHTDGGGALAVLIEWDSPTTDSDEFISLATATLSSATGFAATAGRAAIWSHGGGFIGLVQGNGVVALAAGPSQAVVETLLEALFRR